MSLNLIIKGKTPRWRPLQPVLGYFRSLHKKDNKIVDPSLAVKDMFSKEERAKIDAACIHTASLGVNFTSEEENELKKEAEEIKSIIIKPSGNVFKV